jgi:two-component system KDP operon response regulator KdpE
LNAVWGPEYGDEVEYLRTYIRQLRKKIEDDAAAPKYLITDIKVGYRFWEGDLVGQSQKLSSERTNSED